MTDPTTEAPGLVERLERLHEEAARETVVCGPAWAALFDAIPEAVAALRAADEMREERDKLRDANRTFGFDLCDEHLGAEEPSPGCWLCEIDELRTRLVDEHEGSATAEDARLWEQRAHDKEQEAADLREECSRLGEQKDGAYSERNRLVAALSAVFPSSLERHPDEDESWEDDWRWIVFIDLPTGQATWHIHNSELPLFSHLPRGQGRKWDGHSTDEKYARLARLREHSAAQAAEIERLRLFVREVAEMTMLGAVDAEDTENALLCHGLIAPVEGGFDPERHNDLTGICEPGDPFHVLTFDSQPSPDASGEVEA